MIAGIFQRNKIKLNLSEYKQAAVETLNAFNTSDVTGCFCNNRVLLAQATRFNTYASHNEKPITTDDVNKLSVVSWARIDNRDALSAKLNLNKAELDSLSDSELILKAYLKWKDKCVEHLHGDFVFAISDHKNDTVYAARDRMGIKPFYYYIDENFFIFSSTLTLFHKLDFIRLSPDIEWASRYILHLSMDFEETAYTNISKLKPANSILVSPEKSFINQYFSFSENCNHSLSFDDALKEYRKLLNDAVRNACNTQYPLGSETSGGIDSSTVTALAVKFFNQPISNFYAFGFARLPMEPEYILEVSRHSKIVNNFIVCASDCRKAEEFNERRSLKVLGYPEEHGNASGHEIFYKTASAFGVRTLLSGFGGDEFVTSLHGNLAMYELLESRSYPELLQMFQGNLPLRVLRMGKFILKNKLKKKDQFNPRFYNAFNERWKYQIIKESVVKEFNLKQEYYDTARFDAGYTNMNSFTLQNRWAPFVSTRTDNCTLMANSYGIDYRWPLLDPRMIDYFLSIPSLYKFHKGIGRYFHRKAVEDSLPHKVIWKPTKYMGEPQELFRNPPALNPDICEDLYKIVDLPKLQSLRDFTKSGKEASFSRIRSTHALNSLDNWLKLYFPNGVKW